MSRPRIVLSLVVLIGLLALTAGAAAVSFPLVGPPAAEPGLGVPATAPPRPTPPPQEPVRVGKEVQPPKKIRDVRPVYPPEAREAGVEGVVILEVRLATDGTVTDAKVLRSVPQLDQAAIDAVRQWVFEPMIINDAPVPAIMTVTVNFTLEGKAKANDKVDRVGVQGGVLGGVEGGVKGGIAGGLPEQAEGKEKPRKPKRIYYVAPTYPEEAHAQRVEGVVVLEVRIDTDGWASEVKALKGHDLLTPAAIDAVRQWRWEPPAVAVIATITVRFALDDEAEVTSRLYLPKEDVPTPPHAGATDAKLEIVREVKPTYPPEARKAKLAGTVELEILVDGSGRVTSARVLKGPDVFHQAAIDAARQWEFKPPGTRVKATMEFTFTLK